MRGKQVCRLHGGATPAGIASPHFQTGRRSRYFAFLPVTLATHFDPDDPRLVELGEELALTKAGILELLAQLQSGEATGPQWAEATTAWEELKRAQAAGSATGIAKAAQKVDQVLRGGDDRAAAQARLWELLERRSRMVAIESRRRRDDRDMVAREEFGRFAKAILLACAAHVTDRGARAKIQEDVLRVLAISQGPYLNGEVAAS